MKESGRFLKKAAQKLWLFWARGASTSTAQMTEVFGSVLILRFSN
jgi:hypothetical protein